MLVLSVLFWLVITIILIRKNDRAGKLQRIEFRQNKRNGFDFELEYRYACEEYAKLSTLALQAPYYLFGDLSVYNHSTYQDYRKMYYLSDTSSENRTLSYHEWCVFHQNYIDFIHNNCEDRSLSYTSIRSARSRMVHEGYLPDNCLAFSMSRKDLAKYDVDFSTKCPEAFTLMSLYVDKTPDEEVCGILRNLTTKYSFNVC